MLQRTLALPFLCLLVIASAAPAADVHYRITLDKLKITEGEVPRPDDRDIDDEDEPRDSIRPYARLDGDGEIYLEFAQRVSDWNRIVSAIVARAPEGKEVTGRLYLPNADQTGLTPVRFSIPAAADDPDAAKSFLVARHQHYTSLLGRQIPGAAWFRRQATEASEALGDQAQERLDRGFNRRPDETGLDATFNLFTGGRAVSENLQLDRELLLDPNAAGNGKVDVSTIEGITVAEMDWKALVKDLAPKPDSLAPLIPHDQHVVFFPSFAAMVTVIDQIEQQGSPLLRLAAPDSEDGRTREKYERQLCLPLTALQLGPRMVNSIAVTGSDPYLRVGSDVAVIFEAPDPAALRKLLEAQLPNRENIPAAAPANGDIAGVRYTGVVSPDRAVCSYLITLGNAVIVSNSLKQLERLIAVHQGKSPALASLPEYAFFRDRYKLNDDSETAFILLTDATIRRWCGPRWRISDSRRTRAAAVMADLQARHLRPLVAGKVQPQPLKLDQPLLGEVKLTDAGIASAHYNNLEFMTPILELPLEQVTEPEAESYASWREDYQENLQQFFDPIAIRLTVRGDLLAADVSVMPLISGTNYRVYADLVGKARIRPGAGDPHGALVHFVHALDRNSEPMRQFSARGRVLGHQVDILGWLGDTISIYADRDPYWDELAKAEDVEEFTRSNFHRLPVALRVEVSNPLKLAAFLTAIRAFVEGSAPEMVDWGAATHNGRQYVKIRPTAEARGMMNGDDNLALSYVTLPDAVVISLNEDVIKRAIDRHLARKQQKPAAPDEARAVPPAAPPAGPAPATRPWLGESVVLRVDASVPRMIAAAAGRQYQNAMQDAAWANIPILNEWKRLFPQQDPLAVHQRLWHMRLTCPGGGQYVWNDRWQTMESTVYGHPGEPKSPATIAPILEKLGHADFGLTFEPHGLRAKARLEMNPAPDQPRP